MKPLSERLLEASAAKQIELVKPSSTPTALSARMGMGSVALETEDYRAFRPSERGPTASADLDRIMELPRRDLPLIDLTPELRRPEALRSGRSPCPGCDLCRNGDPSLRLIQSQALQEAREVGGEGAPIGVGFGKAGVSLLLATVMGSQKTVLMLPANLREQLEDRDLPMWSRHFLVKTNVIHVVTYSTLSTAKSADVLDLLQPDLIVCDEAHNLRHRSAARTKRFLRYLNKHPQTRLVVMSGTMTNNSLHDYAHLFEHALKQGSPLQLHFPTLSSWAAAIDVSDMPTDMGELRRLCNPGEHVREGFQRRLRDTPGVVATSAGAMDDASCSLIIQERKVEIPENVQALLTKLRNKGEGGWCRPDGEELEDALAFNRVAKQMASGFYYRWVWPTCPICQGVRALPNTIRCAICRGHGVVKDFDWMERRGNWHKAMRSFLSHAAKPGMDSPLLLAQAAATGRWDEPTWGPWAEVKHKDMPPVETVWIDPFLVNDAVKWGKEVGGIIWYEHGAIGRKIAEVSGFPLFGPGKEASTALLAESMRVLKKGEQAPTIICSIKAHGTGKNLQNWNRSLWTSTPSSGSVLEQLIGRCHRPGQKADEVIVELYRGPSSFGTPSTRRARRRSIRSRPWAHARSSLTQRCSSMSDRDRKVGSS